MNRISTYQQFNEEILGGLGDKLKKLGSSLKRPFLSNSVKTEYSKELKQYDLAIQSTEDRQEMKIFHNKRLVGDIKLSDDSKNYPIWILSFYFYESEVPKDDKKYKSPEKIEGQTEQPYAKGSKKINNDSDDAVRTFWKWWSTNTNSGKLKNPSFKIKS